MTGVDVLVAVLAVAVVCLFFGGLEWMMPIFGAEEKLRAWFWRRRGPVVGSIEVSKEPYRASAAPVAHVGWYVHWYHGPGGRLGSTSWAVYGPYRSRTWARLIAWGMGGDNGVTALVSREPDGRAWIRS